MKAGKAAKNRRYAVIAIVIVAVIGAIVYQFMQPKRGPISISGLEIPRIESCEQQFELTQNMTESADCYMEAAIEARNPEICANIGISTARQSDCIKAVIATAPEDPEVYKKLRNRYLRGMFQYQKLNLSSEEFNPDYGIDEYFLDIIRGRIKFSFNISEKHIFICEEIMSVSLKDKCYRQIATIGKNTTICDMISILLEKDQCYRSVAWEAHDPLVCGGIVDYVLRTDCYSELAWMTKDASVCERIEIPERKGICYETVAEVSGDLSVCDRMTDESAKASCKMKASAKAVP